MSSILKVDTLQDVNGNAIISSDGSGNLSIPNLTTTGDINFGDNDKAVFGASSDLQIYHNATNSVIDEQGSGQLLVRSNGDGIFFQNGDSTASIANFRVGTSNEFYYNGAKKLETTSTGATISGDLLITEGTPQIKFTDTDNNADAYIQGSDGNLKFFADDGQESGSSNISFAVDGSEKARIDSSGNVLVGTTNTDPGFNNVVGQSFAGTGQIQVTRDGGTGLLVNRKTSDGELVSFRKDSATVGSIACHGSGTELSISASGTNSSGIYFANSNAALPMKDGGVSDNTQDLGGAGERWDDVYATNGTIQTSDQNEKNTITDSDLGLDFVNRLTPKSYIFNGKTRTHYGLIAQEVETVLSDISKTSTDFAGFIKSDISEEQDGSEYRYGLRYNEFIAPMIKAIQELKADNDALRARIETLENA